MTIFSIGHSNQSFPQFVSLLRNHEVKTLVDVRSAPYSKYVPQFNKEILEKRTNQSGINYVYMGDKLGGKPNNSKYYQDSQVDYSLIQNEKWFQQAVEELLDLEPQPVAIMCAEEDPSNCHREKLVAASLRKMGINVFHIRKDGIDKGNERLDWYF